MTTLLLGFLGLVILPALILAAIVRRFIREPIEFVAIQEDQGKFTG